MASISSIPHTHFLLFLLCFYFIVAAKAATVPAVYIFGDSLADAGNNHYLKLSFLKADFPHNGVDYPGGKATGRFSNGLNTADFLAENLGLPLAVPYLSIPSKSNKTEAFLKGVSFASGGAGILDTTNAGQCLTFNKQIDYFSEVYTYLVQQVGSTNMQYYLSKSIFGFIIGSNEILNYVKSDKKTSPQELVDSMITALQGQLQRIYNLGARKFAFVGTPLIGCCPSLRRKNGSGDCDEDANSVSHLFATSAASLLKELKSEFSDINYSFFDASVPLQQYIQNPASYGFSEAKAACCGAGNLKAKIACLPISSLCKDRSSYVFWDLYHPTEATAKLLSNVMFQGSAPAVYPVNVRQLSYL